MTVLKKKEPTLDELLKELKAQRQALESVVGQLAAVDQAVWVQQGQKLKLLRVYEIAFITTHPRGLDIYTTQGEKYVNFASISQVDQQLAQDQRIMRTHKSYLVNLNAIDTVEVTSSGRVLTFKGLVPELTARVTYEYLDEFHKRLGKAGADEPGGA